MFASVVVPFANIDGTYLASLVLGDLVLGVLVALLGLAVGPAGFGDVDLEDMS
jgi:hypothetical protein